MTIATFINTANIEVITDQGIEMWWIGRKGVRHEFTAEWREIEKVWVSPTYKSLSAELMTIFTSRGEFIVLMKWSNMLSFLKDLQTFVPEKIQKYLINDPES